MSPLLFTAALALSAPADAPIVKVLPSPPPGAVMVKPALPFQSWGANALCNRMGVQALGPDGLPLRKLGELPPGIEEHAVLRLVNGCPVREVVYAGRAYYLEAAPGRMERGLR